MVAIPGNDFYRLIYASMRGVVEQSPQGAGDVPFRLDYYELARKSSHLLGKNSFGAAYSFRHRCILSLRKGPEDQNFVIELIEPEEGSVLRTFPLENSLFLSYEKDVAFKIFDGPDGSLILAAPSETTIVINLHSPERSRRVEISPFSDPIGIRNLGESKFEFVTRINGWTFSQPQLYLPHIDKSIFISRTRVYLRDLRDREKSMPTEIAELDDAPWYGFFNIAERRIYLFGGLQYYVEYITLF